MNKCEQMLRRGGVTTLLASNSSCEKTQSCHAAFTLAEVLITLAIIGVVAAMTIPTLVADYKQKQTIVKLQKTYSVLKNAFELSRVDNGDFSSWSWNHLPTDNAERCNYFLNKYLFPYIKTAKKCIPLTSECFAESAKRLDGTVMWFSTSEQIGFVLNDGTTIQSWTGGDNYQPHAWFFVDTNGLKSPNILGKDIFAMYFTTSSPLLSYGDVDEDSNEYNEKGTFSYPIGLSLYGENFGLTIEEMLSPSIRIKDTVTQDTIEPINITCSTKGSGRICGALIKLNGWEIPEEYPKF